MCPCDPTRGVVCGVHQKRDKEPKPPTAAQLAEAQAKLDAYNAATGSDLKMERPTSAPLNLTYGKLRNQITAIVERTFPVPRGENCLPVGEMERALTDHVSDVAQAVYNEEGARLKAAKQGVTDAMHTISRLRDELSALGDLAYRFSYHESPSAVEDLLVTIVARAKRAAAGE